MLRLAPGYERKIQLVPGTGTPRDVLMLAMRYFDENMFADPGTVHRLDAFIAQARRIERDFECTPEAQQRIIEEIDARRRADMAREITADSVEALARVRPAPFQLEGIRFAFARGRSVLCDAPGLGSHLQALATALEMRRLGMVRDVLVLCPTSLKYAWRDRIKALGAGTVTVIEGSRHDRRPLYSGRSDFRIVSYHTFVNDNRAVEQLKADFVIFDKVNRFVEWSHPIWSAPRRLRFDYAIALSDLPLDGHPTLLWHAMSLVKPEVLGPHTQFADKYVTLDSAGKFTGYRFPDEIRRKISDYILSRTPEQVCAQLPAVAEETIAVPVTKEQRALHDKAGAEAADIVRHRAGCGFLSETNRRKIPSRLARMCKAADTTALLTPERRSDVKPAEIAQQILAAANTGSCRAVICTRWDHMGAIIAEELARAGISALTRPRAKATLSDSEISRAFAQGSVQAVIVTDSDSDGPDLQGATLLVNADRPWLPATLQRRMRLATGKGPGHLRIVSFVSVDSVEEMMPRLPDDDRERLAAALDSPANAPITFDDEALHSAATLLQLLYSRDADAPATPAPPNTTDIIEKLADALIHTDKTTGALEVRIPVSSRSDVTDFLKAASNLLKNIDIEWNIPKTTPDTSD